jgi:hypothetical protein
MRPDILLTAKFGLRCSRKHIRRMRRFIWSIQRLARLFLANSPLAKQILNFKPAIPLEVGLRRTISITVLRNHSITSSKVSRLMPLLRWQQGQRWRPLTSATISSLCSVAIEVGLCRSGRTGGSAPSSTSGNFRLVASRLVSNSSRGGKATLGDQEGISGQAHGRVVMKASPFAPLVIRQPDLLFEFLVVALDPEAQFGQADQFLERRPGRQRREPILGRRAAAGGPFDEQPLGGTRFTPQIIAMRRARPHGGKARTHCSARAFTPTDLAEPLGGQAECQFGDRHGVVFGRASQPRRLAPAAAVGLGRQRPLALGPDGGLLAHADTVAQLKRRQTITEIGLVTESRVGADDAQINSGRDRRLNLGERDAAAWRETRSPAVPRLSPDALDPRPRLRGDRGQRRSAS